MRRILAAAVNLGNLAYQLLRAATGATVGLYRESWLQIRDGFGVGRHPERDVFRHHDFSFWYEIALDE